MRNHDRSWNIIISPYLSENFTSCHGHSAPGFKYQKANTTVALADALKAVLVMCLSSRVRDLFLWP